MVEACDARFALETIDSEAAIDLLLTAIVIPGGMNGHELAGVATQRRPHLRGHIGVTNGNGAAAHRRILRKPYRKDKLLHCVHEALSG